MSQIILASQSPRRKELLEQMGLEFDICPAKGEEVITKKIPAEVVEELSKQKAEEVASMVASYGAQHEELTSPSDILVIGADTIVAFGDEILGKPKDVEHAKAMLRKLSGNTHQVYTGVTIVIMDTQGRCGEKSFVERTEVTMYPMSEEEINRYVESGEPMDKAGSYGIQGKGAIHIKEIHGDYNNVVGLPIARLYQELESIGLNIYLW